MTSRLAAMGLTMALVLGATAAQARDLVLERYFAGVTHAEGRFSAINGANRGFKVKLTGTSKGRVFRLREDFVYDDGERDRKTWVFTKISPGTYTGTREDVIGTVAIKVVGDTARFTYEVYLDSKAQKNKVRFHDRMTLRDDGTVLNNALVTKFGFPVAKTRVVFNRD